MRNVYHLTLHLDTFIQSNLQTRTLEAFKTKCLRYDTEISDFCLQKLAFWKIFL